MTLHGAWSDEELADYYYKGWVARGFALEAERAYALELRAEARRIMRAKGSYDCPIDPRVSAEYERAYDFIQKISLASNQGPSAPQQASGSGPVPVSVEEAGSRAVETKQDSCAQGPDNDRRCATDTPVTEHIQEKP